MAAAWELSRLGNWDIDIYEQSARFGGKGASSRDASGRILDHGLHVWLGCYENAFRMIRECYGEVERREWGPGAAKPSDRLVHASFEDAFFPEPNIGVMQRMPDGRWAAWSAPFPPEPGLPGDPLDETRNPFTPASYLLRCLSLLKTLMLSVVAPPDQSVPGELRSDARSMSDEMLNHDFSGGTATTVLIERLADRMRDGTLTGAAVLLQALRALESYIQPLDFAPEVVDSAVQLVKAVVAQVRKVLADIAGIDPAVRTKTQILDIVSTTLIGLFRDRILFSRDGLDAINDIDYRDWLRQNGASPESVDSAYVCGAYDFVFAYANGDRTQPRLAAGVACRGWLRMNLTYRGAMFWRMRSGMGETVFAPLYKALTAGRPIPDGANNMRPSGRVRVHFLHRLRKIVIDPAREALRVQALEFDLLGTQEEIDRLREGALDEFGCWAPKPEAVPWDCLAPEPPQQPIHVDDFDAVIFAMGIDDLRPIWREIDLTDRRRAGKKIFPRYWEKMFTDVKTAATQSAQIWMRKPLDELGWHRQSALVSGVGLSFGVWADMTYTLATEARWRYAHAGGIAPSDQDQARSVAYFCGPLPDAAIAGQTPEQVKAAINAQCDELFQGEVRRIWPAFDPADDDEVSRFVEANVTGSDRYTLSLPGTPASRISPLDGTLENATIAGDWTACGLDVGCIEAAVMSGMLAAHAISGQPALSRIVGYDHP